MTELEVLQRLACGESAYGLLIDADPNLERRFRRMCRTMNTFLQDVQSHFPDAQYYTASGGFHLLLGNSHNQDTLAAQSELIALTGRRVSIGDGDF